MMNVRIYTGFVVTAYLLTFLEIGHHLYDLIQFDHYHVLLVLSYDV